MICLAQTQFQVKNVDTLNTASLLVKSIEAETVQSPFWNEQANVQVAQVVPCQAYSDK